MMLTALLAIATGLAPARQPGASPMTQPSINQPQQVTIFADPNTYATFPQFIRTEDELIVTFNAQNLGELKAAGLHPHYGMRRSERYAVQRLGQAGWTIMDTLPIPAGRVLDAGRTWVGFEQAGGLHLKRGWDSDRGETHAPDLQGRDTQAGTGQGRI
jgi:hypothetical protein